MPHVKSTNKKVTCIGRIMVDIVITGLDFAPAIGEHANAKSYVVTPGGGPSYVAIGLSKLGIKAGIIALTGNDFFGKYLQNIYEECDVDVSGIEIDDQSETTLSVEMSFSNDRATLATGKHIDPNLMSKKNISIVKESDHVHLIGLTPERIEILKIASEIGVTTSVDTDLRRDDQRKLLKSGCPYIDFFMPNLNELQGYSDTLGWEDVLIEVGSMVRKSCVVKLGSNGAASSDGKSIIKSPAFPVSVVDTTGAGDMFNSGFIFGILNKNTLKDAMLLGNALGALKVVRAGINNTFPDLDGLKSFLKKNNHGIIFDE